ncbi:MAG: tRNA (N(6)-L-threonylcarbamoyladenosine(37)-C(2))-methylthiotransferase MtaB [Lachnospiraceae bacterium]|nr:tRNA (N(6)-L-threonylcarbamoyladenosine(37)-C(2))-methylthiotransferase MtaB [Lachnospiraceae bacterium]
MKRAALHNLGCKVNAYETEKMRKLLEKADYEIVPFSEEADVYVINTCSVTAIADKKSRQMIRRARRKNPKAIVVAAGCFAQGVSEAELAELGCDLAIGNNEKNRLIERLKEYEANASRFLLYRKERWEKGDRFEEWEEETAQNKSRTRAFVKVQDGCDRFCSYCIIPFLRGRSRSRLVSNVITEIRRLCEAGYQEIVLTGIHVSDYASEGTDLLGLCRAIDRETDVKRLRLGSLEPNVVTEEFAKGLSELPSICPHFHLSLQSGSDTVLRRMNRRYTTAEFAEGVRLLRSSFENPAITTDVIAGFPGETEEEFLEGTVFLERMRFFEMHVFPYSRRPGTKADEMDGQISCAVKDERTAQWIALAERMSEAYRALWDGKEAEVLFERKEKVGEREQWTGFSREYVRFYHSSEEDLTNKIVRLQYKR